MSFDRKSLPIPVGGVSIHKPIDYDAKNPLRYSTLNPSFCNFGLPPGSIVTVGNMNPPNSIGELEVPEDKKVHVHLNNGIGFIEAERIDSEKSSSVTFRSASVHEFFVLEKLGKVRDLYDAAVPMGDYSLYLLNTSDIIELRAGDIIIGWERETRMFYRMKANSLTLADMGSVIFMLPETHGVSCRTALLEKQTLLNIWETIHDFLGCWICTSLPNAAGITCTLDSVAYDAYIANLQPSLSSLKNTKIYGTEKRKMHEILDLLILQEGKGDEPLKGDDDVGTPPAKCMKLLPYP
jgi:hypothetical protein